MLPLEVLSVEAKAGLRKHGIDPYAIDLALELDLDEEGNFGETWMCLSMAQRQLYCMSISSTAEAVYRRKKAKETGKPDLSRFDEARFDTYEIDRLSGTYVDNFVSSNRMLSKLDAIPEPQGEDAEKETPEQKKARAQSGETIIISFCTNSKKRKLFAFIDIMERLKRGDELTAEDPIFEQFNLKCPKCGRRYKDQNRKICEHCTNNKAVVVRLLKYFNGFKAQFVMILFCLVMTSVISLVSPIINNLIFLDQVIESPGVLADGSVVGQLHEEKYVYILIAVIFGMALLSLGISILHSIANAHMSTRVTLNMKLDIFTAMQKLSLSFFNNNQTGRLITRVNSDAENIRGFFISDVPNLIVNGLNFIGLTIFLFYLNWKLTLIVFIPVPLVVGIFKFMLPKLWRMYSMSWRRQAGLNAVLSDSLTGVRVVKAFAKEAEETNRFYGYAKKQYVTNLQLNMVSLTIFPLVGLLIGITSNIIWGFGGMNVMNETMTYGEFSTYLSYLGMIFGPLNFFTNFTNSMTNTANSAQRMFEIIDTIPEITDAKDAVEIERFNGSIEFKKVCFHYTPNRPILKDVSFKINPGDHIGLVGHTGAGKSTIANLINRLYDVISGSIEIDGVNVKKIAGKSMRKNIAIVSQEVYLFKGTIAENIAYGKPGATMDEIVAAAKAANAHDFIISMPNGYETQVGTGNRYLSGGEQQRISIARALLLDPAILILDEATAAMDTETERLIQDALSVLIEGRTTITIAHRLSTLKDCNHLFVLENGEIAEEGTHDELIEKKGIFFRLYTLQNEAMKKVLQGM